MWWRWISIHAPRGGSDVLVTRAEIWSLYFNPRSPWGERPGIHAIVFSEEQGSAFQSTLPVGGATRHFGYVPSHRRISIHAPRGGSDVAPVSDYNINVLFQSTLPVGGATLLLESRFGFMSNFNPRSPWGERPGDDVDASFTVNISIHAPRGGSDSTYSSTE